MQQALKFCLSH